MSDSGEEEGVLSGNLSTLVDLPQGQKRPLLLRPF